MIEADKRKAAFLRTANRELGLDACVVDRRLEHADPVGADVVTARALAPLDRLLVYVDCHLAPGGRAILPKGRGVDVEIEAARRGWSFEFERHPSRTAAGSSILVISKPTRVGGGDDA